MHNVFVDLVRRFPAYLLGAILSMAPGFVLAQAGCDNIGTLTFPTASGGAATLNAATVRNVTGSNNDDRDIGMNRLNNPETSSNGSGVIEVEGLAASDFPTTGIRANGFNRRVNRFWRIDYAPGQYSFFRRNRLEVDVQLSIAGDEATNGSSEVSVEPEHVRLRTSWYPGTNNLRRLEGDVRFRYRDMHRLAENGVHNANLDVCVEVTGNL